MDPDRSAEVSMRRVEQQERRVSCAGPRGSRSGDGARHNILYAPGRERARSCSNKVRAGRLSEKKKKKNAGSAESA